MSKASVLSTELFSLSVLNMIRQRLLKNRSKIFGCRQWFYPIAVYDCVDYSINAKIVSLKKWLLVVGSRLSAVMDYF
jgi:hypothetical protein